MKYLFSLIIFSLITFSSCYEDSFVEETAISTFDTERVFLSQITGTVVDTSGVIIPDAIVSISEMRTMTDREGKFILFDVPIKDEGSVVSASKPGYIDNATRIYKKNNLSHDVTLVLIPESVSLSVDGASGGTVNDPSGISLSIEPLNFLQDGQPYSSEILIRIYWVDVDQSSPYPKGLQISEVLEDNVTPDAFNILSSSSMAYITVLDERGNKLDVDPNMPIKVSFPANDVSQLDASQSDQSLLSYDPNIGLWVDEGLAFYNGSNFTAELSHFSWWSVGGKSNAVEYCYEFTGDQSEISNALLYTLSKTDGTVVKVGSVKLSDTECIFLEVDSQLELKVYSGCFKELYSQTITPSQVSGTDIIGLEIVDKPIIITGSIVNCDREVISDSVEIVYSTELSQDVLGIVQEDFTINLDPCFNAEFLFVSALKEGIVQATAEVDIIAEVTEYSVNLILCQSATDTESILSLDDIVFSGAVARRNPEETIIIAGDASEPSVILAFDGFSEGVFSARVIDNAANFCEGEVEITQYGDVGELIVGTYTSVSQEPAETCPFEKGSFSVVREK